MEVKKAQLLAHAFTIFTPQDVSRYLTMPMKELHAAFGHAHQCFRDSEASGLESLILYRTIDVLRRKATP